MAPVPLPSADTSLAMRLCFAGVLLAVLAALLTFAAVAPEAMALLVGGIPLSLILAALMIAFAIGSTGLYVVLANRRTP